MLSNKYMKRKNGFSLVEIVIIAGIISVVTSILTVSYKNFLNNQRLNAAVEGTVSMIQKARERTLSSRDESGGSGKQYGVRFNISSVGGGLANTIQLLDKTTGNEVVDLGTAGPAEEVRFTMPGGITIQVITVPAASGNSTDVYFKRISGDAVSSTDSPILIGAYVDLLVSSSGKTKRIWITPTGIIEVQ